ncbi:hypothetical protein PLICRDRAFT_46126 [Plicaturopsis crispa FD-325 SS-3]|uniref:NAD(P)-binding protein n=1 Tax=Plicaturopsis crispa FD-325 SS-3 TaxID=944288 RepID=A0A0C9T4Q1_PLICR|nr:hypothetical protein PLICRDRAFT_46126 [Plicaturopsis crispa FD-325 SS-3]
MSTPRVWFITGSSSGFGRSLTELVLKNGDIAIATLRKPDALKDLSDKYPKERLLVLKLDVSKPAEIEHAFSDAEKAFGRIDVVFNNAAYGVLGEIEGTPEDVARAMFDVVFWGAANVSRAAVRFFREVNKPGVGGLLLQVSSMAAYDGLPGVGYYSASKAALQAFSEALSKELDPTWKIQVVVISPGGFETQGTKSSLVQTPPHPAYANPALPTTGFRAYIDSNPRLKGDANKATQAIFNLVTQRKKLPFDLPLGKDAIAGARAKNAKFENDVNDSVEWSENLEFED